MRQLDRPLQGVRLRASAREDVGQALILEAATISRLWALIAQCGEVVVAEAKCADGLTRHFETLDALLSYENSRRQRILSIEFRSQSEPNQSWARISLESDRRNFSLEADNDSLASAVRQGLIDLFDDARGWYSFTATHSPATGVFLVCLLFGSIAPTLFLGPQFLSRSKTTFTWIELILTAVYTIVLMALSLFIMWASERLRRRYFPVLSFAIGQGLDRHRHEDKIRWVIVGAIISVITGSVFFAIAHSGWIRAT